MKFTKLAIFRTSPIGIASLIASTVGGIEDLQSTFIRLGTLIGTVVGGCAIHQILLIPGMLIVFIFTRRNPYPVIFKAAKPWLVALSTTSSWVFGKLMNIKCVRLGDITALRNLNIKVFFIISWLICESLGNTNYNTQKRVLFNSFHHRNLRLFRAVSTPAIFESCDKLRVDKRVSAVAVPLAVTLNREGSALFVSVVCLFLAQISSVALNMGQYILMM